MSLKSFIFCSSGRGSIFGDQSVVGHQTKPGWLGSENSRQRPEGSPHEIHLPGIRVTLRGQLGSVAVLARKGFRDCGTRIYCSSFVRPKKSLKLFSPFKIFISKRACFLHFFTLVILRSDSKIMIFFKLHFRRTFIYSIVFPEGISN